MSNVLVSAELCVPEVDEGVPVLDLVLVSAELRWPHVDEGVLVLDLGDVLVGAELRGPDVHEGVRPEEVLRKLLNKNAVLTSVEDVN